MKLYLLRCDECGAEATSEKHAGPCPGCGKLTDVYLCVCGCGVDLCIPCLDAVQNDGTQSASHHWRVVAEIDAPNNPRTLEQREAATEVTRLESVALSEVFTKDELASLYASARSMAALITASGDPKATTSEAYLSLVSAANKIIGAISLIGQEAV